MNNEDRKYLRSILKTRPSFEAFNKLVEILKVEQEKVDQLFTATDTFLLDSYKTA
jgi:hypothetical protein